MDSKIKWGILSTAYIGTEHVIPAMMKSEYSEVNAIASRNYDKAKTVANKLNIPKYYGTYEELLKDNEIEAVYIPLPNHLHVPWAIKCLEAGKHVLVEKPIGLSSEEAQKLLEESKKYPNLKIMEAFMYKFHPQWIKVKQLVDEGEIGTLRNIQSSFSFYDDNPESITNKSEMGGGSLMDIGCYPISLSRLLFNSEPKKISGMVEIHHEFKVDVLASAILEFENGYSSFFSSTLLEENQKVEIFGTKGKIEILVPFNPEENIPAKILLTKDSKETEIQFERCNQYTIQADLFSKAILENGKVPTSLYDSIHNMKVIEKIIESSNLGKSVDM